MRSKSQIGYSRPKCSVSVKCSTLKLILGSFYYYWTVSEHRKSVKNVKILMKELE